MQQTKKVNYFHLSLKNGQTEKISFSNSFHGKEVESRGKDGRSCSDNGLSSRGTRKPY